MKSDSLGNGFIGLGGTLLAAITSENVAVIAGLSTAAWMLWQLGCSMYDRARRK